MADPATEAQIRALYEAFNRRDSSFVTAQMAENVSWPKAFKGGTADGPEAVRAYWEEQWTEIDPTVEPTEVTVLDDGRVDVTVHQMVRDLDGNLIGEGTVHHVYTFVGSLIQRMEIPSGEQA
jgi:hypothetical protein